MSECTLFSPLRAYASASESCASATSGNAARFISSTATASRALAAGGIDAASARNRELRASRLTSVPVTMYPAPSERIRVL